MNTNATGHLGKHYLQLQAALAAVKLALGQAATDCQDTTSLETNFR